MGMGGRKGDRKGKGKKGLKSPKGGFRSKKLKYPKGDLGYCGDKINDMVKRMV